MRRLLIALACMTLGACASIVTGTEQEVKLTSEPAGAECRVMRGTLQLARVRTPATVKVPRDKVDLGVVCAREGYENAHGTLMAEFERMAAGNILIGGLVGIMIDQASGATNRYRDALHLTLNASSPAAVAQVARETAEREAQLRVQTQAAPAAQVRLATPAPAKATEGPSLHELPLGAKVRDIGRIGRAQLPLPEGEWEVSGRALVHSPNSQTPIGRVVLLRWAGREPDGMIVAWANLEPNPAGWRRSAECERTDMHAVAVVRAQGMLNECWWVSHYVHPRISAQSGMHFVELDGVLRARGLEGMPSFLAAGMYVSDRYDMLWARYSVRPGASGIPDERPASWSASAWHSVRAANDPAKQRLIDWQRQWAEGMFPAARRGLDAGLDTVPALPPPPSVAAAATR